MRVAFLIEVDGAGRSPIDIRLDSMHIGVGSNLAAAGALRHSNGRSERTGLRANFAAKAQTEAAIDASASPRTRLRINCHGCRERMPAKLPRGALEYHARRLHRQRRHGIRLRPRRIERAGSGKAGNADLPFHFRIVRFEVRVLNRPIHEAGARNWANLAAFDEIDLVKPPEIRCEMYAGPADASPVNHCTLRLGLFVRRFSER